MFYSRVRSAYRYSVVYIRRISREPVEIALTPCTLEAKIRLLAWRWLIPGRVNPFIYLFMIAQGQGESEEERERERGQGAGETRKRG